MGTININGITYSGVGSITVKNGIAYIGKNKIVGNLSGTVDLHITGDVRDIKCDGSVTVSGNAKNIDCGGSATVNGDVNGNIDCGGSCSCENVTGDIDAGGSVKIKR